MELLGLLSNYRQRLEQYPACMWPSVNWVASCLTTCTTSIKFLLASPFLQRALSQSSFTEIWAWTVPQALYYRRGSQTLSRPPAPLCLMASATASILIKVAESTHINSFIFSPYIFPLLTCWHNVGLAPCNVFCLQSDSRFRQYQLSEYNLIQPFLIQGPQAKLKDIRATCIIS